MYIHDMKWRFYSVILILLCVMTCSIFYYLLFNCVPLKIPGHMLLELFHAQLKGHKLHFEKH